MFTRQKKARRILRMGFDVNLTKLENWIESGEEEIPAVQRKDWGKYDDIYEYMIYVLPVDTENEWYFHKTANEYSHKINAIIELEERINYENLKDQLDGNLPDLEILMGNENLIVTFARKPLIFAPIHEAGHIMTTGKTSNENPIRGRKGELKIPTLYDNSGNPKEYDTVYEHIMSDGAGYSNSIVHFWMDSPDRLVVIKG